MKKLLLLPILVLVFISCSSDDDPIDNMDPISNSNDSSDFFDCKIDGTDYHVEDQGAYALKDFDAPGSTNVYGVIDPTNANTTIMYIRVDDTAPLNVDHDFDEDAFFALVTEGVDGYATYPIVGGSGFVRITERDDENIAGTFAFTATNIVDSNVQMVVTEGSFNVLYQ